MDKANELIIYVEGDLAKPVNIAFDGETLWLSRSQIAQLFQTTADNVRGHIKNIYNEGELDVTSTSKKIYGVVENRPNYGIEHYNLDVVISVGYRVSTKVATKFRQWATNVIKQRIAIDSAGLSYDRQRVLISDRVAIENQELLDSALKMGVEDPVLFFDSGYQGMYGMRMADIKKIKGIGNGEKLLDRANTTELVANEFRITQANDRLKALMKEGKLVGNTVAITTHFDVGREVKEAVERIGGTAPKDHEVEPDNIQDVKKRLSISGDHDKKLADNSKKD